MDDIYGGYAPRLHEVEAMLCEAVAALGEAERARTGHSVIEHVRSRVKEPESMREKCLRHGLAPTPENALTVIHDAVGLRIVTRFIDDIDRLATLIRALPGIEVTGEKDYVRSAKPNGYRSYHMILWVETPFEDITGQTPGHIFAEVQLRTIAMDTWASLEHELHYKQDIPGERLIAAELKRVADELASCDVSMQTIRNLIRQGQAEGRGAKEEQP